MNENYYDVIVVGGGPAGLIAAGKAALATEKVLLIEKMPYAGQKLLLTGQGRCNLTNASDIEDFFQHFSRNRNFLKNAFHSFSNIHLMDFFKQLGIPLVIERGNRVFPASQKAKDILEALLNRWVKKNGVIVKTNEKVIKLLIDNNTICGVKTVRKTYKTQKVILATGGLSYPFTGSTGEGFQFAKAIGHNIIPLHAALIPLVVEGGIDKKLQGLILKNVQANVWVDLKKHSSYFGEMNFTEYGISGPIVLTLSRFCVKALASKQQVKIYLDLKPNVSEKELDIRLLNDIQVHRRKHFINLLKEYLPSKMIKYCLHSLKIDPHKCSMEITANERKKLRYWLKNLEIKINKPRPVSEAIVTSGGIDILEVDKKTMASKLINNLYFAGEILDLDANTGGYNLQAAFSTGWLAGKNTANQ